MPSLNVSLAAHFDSKPCRASLLVLALRVAHHRLSQMVNAELPTFKLTVLQHTLLSILNAQEKETAQAGIVELLRENERELTCITVGLMDRGLLTRRSEPAPPHAVFLSITDLGRSCLNAIDAVVFENNPKFATLFTQEEWDAGVPRLARVCALPGGHVPQAQAEVLAFPAPVFGLG